MARVFLSGWEMSTSTAVDGGMWLAATNAVLSAPEAYTGAYALRIQRLSAAASNVNKIFAADGSISNWYGQVRFKYDTAPDSSGYILELWDVGASGMLGSVRIVDVSGSKYLRLYDNSVQLGSDYGPLSSSTWYLLEFSYVYSTRLLTLYINRSSVASGTVNATYDSINRIYVGWSSAQNGDLYYDDFILDNSTLPGDGSTNGGRLIQMVANGDGTRDTGETAPTRGGVDSGADWTQVNEDPPDDATEYIIFDATTESCPVTLTAATGVVTSGDAIRCVAIHARHRASSTGAMGYRRKIRGSSGTWAEADGATIQHNDSTWKTDGDTTYNFQLPAISLTNPDTAAAWTISELDSAEISVRAYDTTPNLWLTAEWAIVEHYTAVSATKVTDLIQMGIIPFAR